MVTLEKLTKTLMKNSSMKIHSKTKLSEEMQYLKLFLTLQKKRWQMMETKKSLINSFLLSKQPVTNLAIQSQSTKTQCFFPSEENVDKLCDWISKAEYNLRICIFTLTNNSIAKAVKERHEAGVKVQIITDDECMKQRGSDIEYLASKGIDVRTDDAERYHMHNKFVVVDNKFVITGSFNWTVQAVKNNQENLMVVDHPYFVHEYKEEFKKLWAEFSNNEVEAEEYKSRGKKKYSRKKAHWNKH